MISRGFRTLSACGCGPPVRGYTGAPPTAPSGAVKNRPALVAGSIALALDISFPDFLAPRSSCFREVQLHDVVIS